MGLYRKIVATSFKTFSTRRFNFYISTIFGFLELVLKISIWQALFAARNGGNLAGISLQDMIAYNIISTFTESFVACRIMNDINEMVQKGEIGLRLLLPLGFRRHMLCTTLATNLLWTLYTALPPVLVASLIYGFRFDLRPVNILLYLLSLVLAVLIGFYLQFLLGLLVFWVRNAFFLDWMTGALMSLFTGSFVPMWFFPGWLNALSVALPFRYIVFEPTAILLGRPSITGPIGILALQTAWVLVLYLAGEAVWWRAKRLVFAQGG